VKLRCLFKREAERSLIKRDGDRGGPELVGILRGKVSGSAFDGCGSWFMLKNYWFWVGSWIFGLVHGFSGWSSIPMIIFTNNHQSSSLKPLITTLTIHNTQQ
jgi:hypothetical protein